MKLEYDPQNVKYIVPFSEQFHKNIIENDDNALDIIIENKATRENVGYLLVRGLTELGGHVFEWTHILIEKKGLGYGHDALKLMKAWTCDVKKAHRLWVDCKDWNERALHLYESEGLKREGLCRETLFTDGVFENLVVLAILADEYAIRRQQGLEL